MKSKVYFTSKINSNNIVKLYGKLGIELDGNTAVKVHSGEDGNQNYMKPVLLKDIVERVNGTIVECNTAYEGQRNTTDKHEKLIVKHGWNTIGEVDILDRDGEIELPIRNGKNIHVNYVGSHLNNYDSMLVVSHFKGHPMGGYGGALKNISIGLASSHGKAYIHGAGDVSKIWTADHDKFLESMAEAASSIMDKYKNKIAFINIMANMSVDCDCCSVAEDPCMKDIGMLASLDPVALDKACLDKIYNSNDKGKDHLIERIESRNGIHTTNTASSLGVGSLDYELIEIE